MYQQGAVYAGGTPFMSFPMQNFMHSPQSTHRSHVQPHGHSPKQYHQSEGVTLSMEFPTEKVAFFLFFH